MARQDELAFDGLGKATKLQKTPSGWDVPFGKAGLEVDSTESRDRPGMGKASVLCNDLVIPGICR